jgi:L-lactate dehydrogenase complex protein LldG
MVAYAGGASMNAREQILAAVRDALADVPHDESEHWSREQDPDSAAAYLRNRDVRRPELVELFEERCGSYRATVTRCTGDPGAIKAAIRGVCTRHDVHSLLVPYGVPAGYLPAGIEPVADVPPLTPAQLDAYDGVLSTCALAIASTGTIALDGRAGQGRRALSLVPDLHICIVRAEQLVYGVPEALSALASVVRESRRPLTLISGPSATSDIELKRVEGVHGPRKLEVMLAC